eukprot:2052788-Prymnesium_polylepis.1
MGGHTPPAVLAMGAQRVQLVKRLVLAMIVATRFSRRHHHAVCIAQPESKPRLRRHAIGAFRAEPFRTELLARHRRRCRHGLNWYGQPARREVEHAEWKRQLRTGVVEAAAVRVAEVREREVVLHRGGPALTLGKRLASLARARSSAHTASAVTQSGGFNPREERLPEPRL